MDDTLGVFSSHAVAGVVGGLLTGVLADPVVTQYVDPGLRGAIYGNFYQLGIQAFAALVVIVYVFVLTYGILRLIGVFMPLKETDEKLKIGDLAIHGESGFDMSYPPSVAEIKRFKEEENARKIESKEKS